MKPIFCVYDIKGSEWRVPFMRNTPVDMRRFVRELAQQPRHPFALYPDDFEVHMVGLFNEFTGELLPGTGGSKSVYPMSALLDG